MAKLTEAQKIALEKFAQAGGHGFGEFSYLSRPTAMALYRRGFIRVGTAGASSSRHSVGIITETGLAALNAASIVRRTADRTSMVYLPYAWSEWPVWHDALAKNRIEVRDSFGVRARPRSLAAAHRITRRSNMAETWVNPDAFKVKAPATRAYVELVAAAIVAYRPGLTRDDAMSLIEQDRSLVDHFHDQVSSGWGKPEDPDTVARVLLGRAGRQPVAAPVPAPAPSEPYAPPPPTAYRVATVREMVRLGMHEGTAEGVAEHLEIDKPRQGAHRTPRQAAKWAIGMQRRIAAAGGT